MDINGMRETLRDMARRIASCGYFVAAPDMFYRIGHQIGVHDPELVAELPDLMDRVGRLLGGLGNVRVAEDTKDLLDHINGMTAARDGKVGLVGYCMGGPFVFYNAGAMADRVACAASLYGVGLMTDETDSPHLLADKVTGELYFGCAEIDNFVSEDLVQQLQTHLDLVDANARIEWYPGTHHGFAFVDRPHFHKAANEKHWQRLIDLFRRNLD